MSLKNELREENANEASPRRKISREREERGGQSGGKRTKKSGQRESKKQMDRKQLAAPRQAKTGFFSQKKRIWVCKVIRITAVRVLMPVDERKFPCHGSSEAVSRPGAAARRGRSKVLNNFLSCSYPILIISVVTVNCFFENLS